MGSQPPRIEIEPYRRVVIHEVIENNFKDFVDSILISSRAAGGTAIPVLQWCNGLVFTVQAFNPNSDSVIREQMNGTVHISAVNFAPKEKFESEVRTAQGTVRLIDVSINPTWVALTAQLKSYTSPKPV
jgi:hypothetical protein